jgi:hypothetical protein
VLKPRRGEEDHRVWCGAWEGARHLLTKITDRVLAFSSIRESGRGVCHGLPDLHRLRYDREVALETCEAGTSVLIQVSLSDTGATDRARSNGAVAEATNGQRLDVEDYLLVEGRLFLEPRANLPTVVRTRIKR